MTRGEALEVLGLAENATADQIRAAWKRLLKGVHPDVGGSDFMARVANAAKETLLGERGADAAPATRDHGATWHDIPDDWSPPSPPQQDAGVWYHGYWWPDAVSWKIYTAITLGFPVLSFICYGQGFDAAGVILSMLWFPASFGYRMAIMHQHGRTLWRGNAIPDSQRQQVQRGNVRVGVAWGVAGVTLVVAFCGVLLYDNANGNSLAFDKCQRDTAGREASFRVCWHGHLNRATAQP